MKLINFSDGILKTEITVFNKKFNVEFTINSVQFYDNNGKLIEYRPTDELRLVLLDGLMKYLKQNSGVTLERSSDERFRVYKDNTPERFTVLCNGQLYRCTVFFDVNTGIGLSIDEAYGNPIEDINRAIATIKELASISEKDLELIPKGLL